MRRRMRNVASGGVLRVQAAWRTVVLHMPDKPPLSDSDFSDYRFWKPDAQAQALELIKQFEGAGWKPFYCKSRLCDGEPHGEWDFRHARADQWPPIWNDPWFLWFMSSGRGAGKTRTGAEVTHKMAEKYPRIALASPTGALLRATLVEGEAGILRCSPPGKMPKWEPSKKQLTFHNGCIAQGFSGEEPERLRSFEHAAAWLDEPSHYDDPDAFWDNLLFGMRMKGAPNKIICTTTPLPNRWTKERIAEDGTVLTRVPTYVNLANLSEVFKERVVKKFEGTRKGKQELYGEILLDVEGSLWKWEMLRWIDHEPELERIVIGVDPAGTANAKSDETGIIVVGVAEKALYILHDETGKYSPDGWIRKSYSLYQQYKADAIVVEKTYGMDITMSMLETSGLTREARVIGVDDRRGKALRADPVVGLYEQGRVYHVGESGDLLDLEEELTAWIPGHGPSPNRVDALVHAATELVKHTMPSALANPNEVMAGMRMPTNQTTRPHLRAV